MFKGNKRIKGSTLRRSLGKIMIVLGTVLMLLSLLVPAWPQRTFAQLSSQRGDEQCRINVSPDTPFELEGMEPGDSCDRSLAVTNPGRQPLYLWLKMERAGGGHPPGEPGDLFSQLAVSIKWRDLTLYSGELGNLEEPLDISGRIGPIRPGQRVDLDLRFSLPGPETGNEFQGASARANITLITLCGDGEEVPPEPPGTDPGDGQEPEPPGTDPEPTELPRTGGFTPLLLLLLGLTSISLGLLLKRGRAGERRV